MNKLVKISEHSKKLIGQLHARTKAPILAKWSEAKDGLLDSAELLSWLKQATNYGHKTRYLLEMLKAALLEDWYQSLLQRIAIPKPKNDVISTRASKTKFHILAAAGTLLAICGGFNSITAVLALTAAPIAAIFVIGITFAAVSAALYFSSDLVDLSKALGVRFWQPSHLLDALMKQVEHISKLKKAIDHYYIDAHDVSELQELQEMTAMLIERYKNLNTMRKECEAALNSPYLKTAKVITSCIKGALICCGGFFGGQTIALAICTMFIGSVSVLFWPVVLTSCVVALAALCVFCFVELAKYENRLSRLLGLDKDKIKILSVDCDKQVGKLNHLQRKIVHEISLRKKIPSSSPNEQSTTNASDDTHPAVSQGVGHHPFFHHQSALSLADTSDLPITHQHPLAI